MSAVLSGRLRAILDHLTTHLGSTRMAKVDTINSNVDAAISTRAAASTALSSATWTNAHAGYLALLNTGAVPGLVKSVQIVTVTMTSTSTANTTVSAVDTAKTIVLECSREHGGTSATDGAQLLARHTLTTTTNLQSRRNGTSGVLTCQVALIEIR